MKPFGPDFFSGNRARLIKELKHDAPIVVTANGLLQASGDNPFPFHQAPNFWYLTGIEQADYTLVIDPNETYIIAPTLSEVQELFDGSASVESIRKTSGISDVLNQNEGWKRLKASLLKYRRVYTPCPNPAYIPLYGMYSNPARTRLIQRMKRSASSLEVLDVRPQIAKLRVIKQPQEVEAIRIAVDSNVATLNDILKNEYNNEYEIEADISRGFRWRGTSGNSFWPVIASGKNACILHYQENNAALHKGDLILADVGSEYQHYASDITRTWSQSKPTDRQKAVYSAVNDALEFGIEQLKPGRVSFYECEQRVREFVGTKLKELKLVKKIDKESIYRFYPHAPHYLGIDVHDVGNTRQPIKPGMVMTLEPGIYVPDEGIGIRLEEDILITENGCEVLSKGCPRTLTPVQ